MVFTIFSVLFSLFVVLSLMQWPIFFIGLLALIISSGFLTEYVPRAL